MNFNRLLLIAFIMIGIVGYIRFQASDNNTVIDQDHTDKIEVLYTKQDFEVQNTKIQKQLPKKILVKVSGGNQIVKVTNIIYCEKVGNKINIHTDNHHQPIESSMTLKPLKEKIGVADFVYNNLNSYIINFNYVEKVMKIQNQMNQNSYNFEIEMENKEQITLPKDKKATFMQELRNYIGDY